MAGAITGDGEGKRRGSAFTPREVPSNFSAAIAPVRLKKV